MKLATFYLYRPDGVMTWAMAIIERVHADVLESPWFHIWQETPTNPSSQGGSRDEASVEAVHQEGDPGYSGWVWKAG
jgi:hypothetical protein